MSHLESYLKIVDEISSGVSPSIRATVDALIPKYIKTFTFIEHITGLLLGNVQSGKTGQVFGLISAAADEGFALFVFLTTDNVYLHEQTLRRALRSLDTFAICGEDDDIRFAESKMRKPAMVILKKNTRVLKRWKNNLASSKYCEGRGLFIVDDEGDAASLNTKINKKEQSAINNHLEGMKKLANSSLYPAGYGNASVAPAAVETFRMEAVLCALFSSWVRLFGRRLLLHRPAFPVYPPY